MSKKKRGPKGALRKEVSPSRLNARSLTVPISNGILKEDGYPDVQAFKRTYDAATALVEQYNRDLAAWERQVNGEKQPQQAPPEKESIRKKLRDMEAEAKRRNTERRQEPRHRSYDYDRGR